MSMDQWDHMREYEFLVKKGMRHLCAGLKDELNDAPDRITKDLTTEEKADRHISLNLLANTLVSRRSNTEGDVVYAQ